MIKQNVLNEIHDKYAPFWAIAMIILMIAGLSVTWFKIAPFCNAYVLDMVGPAWTYILFRGLFTAKADNQWTRFFTPKRTIIILLVAVYGIEMLQFFKVYDSTYDPYDFIAYISIIVPVFIIDQALILPKTLRKK